MKTVVDFLMEEICSSSVFFVSMSSVFFVSMRSTYKQHSKKGTKERQGKHVWANGFILATLPGRTSSFWIFLGQFMGNT